MPETDNRGILLTGLDGSNPLGFLAAVGTLRTLAQLDAATDPRMRWTATRGTWSPELSGTTADSAEALIDLLAPALSRGSTPEFDFAQDLNVSSGTFLAVAAQAQREAALQERRYADFAASFGCEATTTTDEKSIQDTALRTMSGAGHQHFLGTMKDLVASTDKGHLHRSLFERWDYSDDKLGLRWDPEEDRRYALRWQNPSSDTVRTMRGANRLAVEALPLLPTAPRNRQLDTTGFSRQDRAVRLTWPIWKAPLGVDVVRSLLASSEIQRPAPNRLNLTAMGIVEVYRSQRITVGKYRNFSRARPA